MRTRYRYDADLDQVVQVFDHNGPAVPSGPMILKDIEQHYGAPIISPIDGSHITSRSQLREHEIRHGVRQAGDFKKGELVAKENKRVDAIRRVAQGQDFKWL